MSPTRAALEAALRDNPDDLGLHAAYADFLIEAGDPRGEFARLQLALEAPDLPDERRKAMEAAANKVMRRHEEKWLGPLLPLMRHPHRTATVFRPRRFVIVKWRRGWIDKITVDTITESFLDALSACDTVPLLLRDVSLYGRFESRYRAAQLRPVWPVLAQCPVRNLEVVGTRFGDDLVDELIRHGPWARLEDLDLAMNDITDDGAALLAACPAVRRLKSLVVEDNLISPIGAQALAEIGFPVGRQDWGFRREGEYV